MMKKKLLLISIFCLVLLIGGNVQGSISSSDQVSKLSVARNDKTFIAGTVINPSIENETVTAVALQVFYYNPGIFIDEVGVVRGFSSISFTKNMFVMVWTPGPFEVFGYVLGFCQDFEIHE
ncbi:MAG: hypothetical protein KGY50_03810 [Candidatus Thermoplasmatota archaeon]|nr:hypothetical protein [Candidatus Thermoplasmatota archaeon]